MGSVRPGKSRSGSNPRLGTQQPAPVAQLVPRLGADVRQTAARKNSRESAPGNRLPARPQRERQRERRVGAELAARAARLRAALMASGEERTRTAINPAFRGVATRGQEAQ
jgi:hypothetical protein